MLNSLFRFFYLLFPDDDTSVSKALINNLSVNKTKGREYFIFRTKKT